MQRIGLTGGIGSGKSTVASMLVQRGAALIDTDAIARSLTLPGGQAMGPIAAQFGQDLVQADGALDRDRMRQIVFQDASAKRRLEAILHPLIGMACDHQAAQAQDRDIVVFDVPLLVESGRWRARVDRVLVVDATEATQMSRVMARNGWSAEAVQAVIAQQASREARRAAADAVIFNEGLDLAQLQAEVDGLLQQWMAADRR
ncbi:dephospho-CoA kinase [Variovorax robiniae]|uniref:Dephospho-CoA kinase n=1 Tax=Variovorax robiniae TaxID=1836199 RepID=A0ABU8X3F0_9BURK